MYVQTLLRLPHAVHDRRQVTLVSGLLARGEQLLIIRDVVDRLKGGPEGHCYYRTLF